MVTIGAVGTVGANAVEVISAQAVEGGGCGAAAPHGRRRRTAVRAVNPTRRRILDAARALFNDRGTAHVTTNHIAAAAGLSPGNLYYWFRNKQQVVRALVDEWIEAVDARVADAHDQPVNVHALWDDLFRTADLDREYRFVRREAAALVLDDAELERVYRAAYRRRVQEQSAYLARLVRVGDLHPPAAPRTLDDLAVALWMVAEYWPAHAALALDDASRLRREGRQTGVRPMLVVLSPYLTEQGIRALESL